MLRARGTNTKYYWGDDVGVNNANCDGCGSQWDDKRAAPVGQFKANRFGLHDMLGNVWEWTCSFPGNNVPEKFVQECPSADSNKYRVVQGGSWLWSPDRMRMSPSFFFSADISNNNLGFRVLCSHSIE